MSHFAATRSAGASLKFALIAAGMGCVMAAGAASAATLDPDVPSLVVRYSSYQLATQSGVQEVYRKIVRAAARVCPDADIRNPHAVVIAKACRDQAIARAVHDINNSQLAALYATSSKKG
jgi:UrcA family protein